jgi:hypothetical protein
MEQKKLQKQAILAVCLFRYILSVLLLYGCSSSYLGRTVGLADLDNSDTTVRVVAIKWAGDNKVSQAVPSLVDNLQNEDKAVRFYSIAALSRITGTDCGYDYKASPSSRGQALECWKRFLKSNELESDGN